MRTPQIFSCPNCLDPLEEHTNRYTCPRGHAFDRARAGFVTLRQTARRGDTAAMLHARRAFLARGFFQPISDAINSRVSEHLDSRRQRKLSADDHVIVDVGCGEGYYLARLAESMEERAMPDSATLVGIDASKHAARLTASRLKNRPGAVHGHACAVVDITRGLLVRPGTAAVLFNVFAPKNARAFAETLRPGGLCLIAIPRPEHMRELRARVPALSVPPAKQARIDEQFGAYLRKAHVEDLVFRVAVDPPAIDAWIRMGPSAWHATGASLSSIQQLGAVQTHAAVTLMSFVK